MRLKKKGFTLLELIIVMVLLAIISLVIQMRMPTTSSFSISYIAEQLRRDIRYTQTLATSLNSSYTLATTTNSYSISPAPPTGNYTVNMPSGITLSANTITFDSTGAPQAAATVTITPNSGTAVTVTVLAETGFVNG